MDAAELTGKAVISVTTGAWLGRVDDVLFEAGLLALAALRVSAAGQQALIPFAQVQSLGSDAVIVHGDDVAQWISPSTAAEGLIALDALKSYKASVGADVVVVRATPPAA
jgi:uncharacterized protein YrrD